MRTIEVSDEVYEKLQRAASQRETSVEAYVSGIAEEDDLGWLFTPEFIAEQERIAKEMDEEGGSMTTEEFWAKFEAHRRRRLAEKGE